MNPILKMSSREIAELIGKEHKNVCRVIRDLLSDGILDAQLEPLDFKGIVNSTTSNLNSMGYVQNWTPPQNGQAVLFGGV